MMLCFTKFPLSYFRQNDRRRSSCGELPTSSKGSDDPSSGGTTPYSGSYPSSLVGSMDRVTYTWTNMNVYCAQQEQREGFFGWNRRRYFGERKHILKNVNGAAYPGELLALMGSSGAGKTTLLNTLTFRSGKQLDVTGMRAINGEPATAETITALSAYVQQDDLFIGTLTVREHLIFQALVRMDRWIPYEARMKRVEEVISELALTKCQNTLIGIPGRIKGISGGEMKRLSFASEVLTDPPLLLCDEPTSGLDSFMAQNVVQVLKNMALKGKTVICTIHQPSSEVFAMFDKVLLMAEGRVAYLGTSHEACDFFSQLGAPCPSNYNPADFFIQLLAVVPSREETCRQTVDLICDTFENSEAGQKFAQPPLITTKTTFEEEIDIARSPYKAKWSAQFRAVLWRSWLSVKKEPILIKVRMLQTFMVAMLIGIMFFGQELTEDGVMNINGALFLFLTNMTFQNVFAVINVFCSELPIFMREHSNGMYRADVYFLCKTLAEIPIFIAIPVLFTVVTYFMIGLTPEPYKFFNTALIVTLVANVATSFGYLISSISSSVNMALSIGPPVVIPFLLFGGFFLNTGSVPPYFKWLSNLSWFKYGNEALLINQWSDVDYIECEQNTTCPKNGAVVLQTLNFYVDDFYFDILALLGLIVSFRIFAVREVHPSASTSLCLNPTAPPAKTKLEKGAEMSSLRGYGKWAPDVEGVTLTWHDLSVYVPAEKEGGLFRKQSKPHKRLLNSVSGAVKPGTLVALMGSSGAGKSTLMNALAHRNPVGVVVDGDIRVNGRPIGPYMNNLCGYVPQEDLFVRDLTVKEHLTFMAWMRLDRRTSRFERRRHVLDLLSILGLSERADTRIGATGHEKVLSGGEKKRLAFASELLTDPPLLFCDEPTTGLDSFSAQKIVQMMGSMAAQGKTIVCTIHQPSSEMFSLFHELILLVDGRIAFMGTPNNAVTFFESLNYRCPENYNPADFFIHTLSVTPGDEERSRVAVKAICDQYTVSEHARAVDLLVHYERHLAESCEIPSDHHRAPRTKL
ncbi:Hypothetical predicted protein [Cloeon dipterum]|uniref:Protein white n=1 Tax=Cloeon dipterum TaxID=197152 RepID=A0A8S1CEG9_9INSE|nr:Hypothetical predicted protein [Cloeon dipterum]